MDDYGGDPCGGDGGGGDDDDDDDDNSGGCDPTVDANCSDPNQNDPTDPNKQQLVLGMLNPDCNGIYGGLSNGLQAIAATQYVNVSSLPATPTNDQDADVQFQFAQAQQAGGSYAAYTVAPVIDFSAGFPGAPQNITTYIGNSFYNASPNVQTGILFHELMHGVGYPSADIDFGSYAAQLPQYNTLAADCSPQQVATQDATVPNQIPDPSQ
jgi:hypothetical protein